MNTNKDARIEIRIKSTDKEKLQNIAKAKNTTISKILYDYIKTIIQEEK